MENSIRIPDTFPSWAPADVVDWLRKVAHANVPLIRRTILLTTDARMREVWDWYFKTGRDCGFDLCYAVSCSCALPSFPGDLTLNAREEYFAKVRKHTESLIELLKVTRYGSNCETLAGRTTEDIDQEKLADVVTRDLAGWGEDETGHVVAYYVDEDGVSRFPWNYPESSLCDLLHDVLEWTYYDDGFDWSLGLRSSKPLENAKGVNRRITYFVRTLFERLYQKGIEIPFSHLATLANVTLALPANSQADEDAVRKQVRRYQHLLTSKPRGELAF